MEEYMETDRISNVTIPSSSSVTKTLEWNTGTTLARGYYTVRGSTDTQATSAKSTQRIWFSPLPSSGPVNTTSTVDDFEDGNLSEYEPSDTTNSWTTGTTNLVNGSTNNAQLIDSSGNKLATVSDDGSATTVQNYPTEGGTLFGRVRHDDPSSSVGLCVNASRDSTNNTLTMYAGVVNLNTQSLILKKYVNADETDTGLTNETVLTERVISVDPQTYYWMEMKPVNASGELELLLYEYDSSTDTRENLISRIQYTDSSPLTSTERGIGLYQRSGTTDNGYIDFLQRE